MPLNKTAWAINGAPTDALLARIASYAESDKAEGVLASGDLRVTPLSSPGSGFQLAPGVAILHNRYQATPNQSYTVYNDGSSPSVFGSSFMPPVNANSTSHLICIVVGDPGTGHSQSGHPFMLASDPPVGTESTFQYVRVVVIPNVPPTTTSFAQLNRRFPAIALARVDLAAGATWVTSGNLVDLRRVARPRSHEEMRTASSSTNNDLGNGVNVYENWPNSLAFDVFVPEWSTMAKVQGFVEGIVKKNAGQGGIQISIDGAGAGSVTNIDEAAPSGTTNDRVSYNVAGEIAIPAALRGTTVKIRVQAKVSNTTSKFFLSSDPYTGGMIRVRFEETV